MTTRTRTSPVGQAVFTMLGFTAWLAEGYREGNPLERALIYPAWAFARAVSYPVWLARRAYLESRGSP